MNKTVNYKNADKKVRRIYLNGLLQEKNNDYYLTKNNIKLTVPFEEEKWDILMIESQNKIKIIQKVILEG